MRFLASVVLVTLVAQPTSEPINDRPNPYQTLENYFKLPAGRTWGSTSAVDIDRDGRSVWVVERCGANSCAGSTVDPILRFDAAGRLVKSFGAGMFIFPHGIHVDRDGNIWVTDGRAATPQELEKSPDARGKGHQVFKFRPDGKVLLTIGKAGVAGHPPEALTEPNDVITTASGEIIIAEGHSGQNPNAPPNAVARISHFSRDGTFIRSWGKLGSGPGEFRTPHGLAFDSRGRLFVADRGNVRLQIFDKDYKFLEEWKQFSRLSGIAIGKDDMLYGADSESSPTSHPGWTRGMRIGSAKTGEVMYFIPDPEKNPTGTSAAEGVAVDAAGNIYGAEVGPKRVVKYVKRTGTQ